MNGTSNDPDLDITTLLLKTFPEFATSPLRAEIYENDGPYTYMSYFGDFLLQKIDNADTDFINRAFEFINQCFDDSTFSRKLWDLFVIEIFERFDMDESYTGLARANLHGKALDAFLVRKGRDNG